MAVPNDTYIPLVVTEVNSAPVLGAYADLHAAKRLGMRTVWVNAGNKGAPYVDVKIRDVMQLPQALHRLN